jgi:hypothetical protein
MSATSHGFINGQNASWTIVGDASAHMAAGQYGVIATLGGTIAIPVAKAFVIFAWGNNSGHLEAWSMTISGAGVAGTTGKRYQSDGNSVIFTNGGGASYFPGNSSGTTATGGQYF